MKIIKKSVVKLNYNLSDESGKLIDSSDKNGSLIYIHGVGIMMPGIEKVVDGQESGFNFSGIIEPEDGYGEYKPEKVIPVPRVQFEHFIDEMEEGKLYNFDTGGGSTQLLKIIKIDEEFVTVDSNHPYAGERLALKCVVEDVRVASEEELKSIESNSGCGCGSHGSESGGCCSSDNNKSGGCCSNSDDKSGKGSCNCKH